MIIKFFELEKKNLKNVKYFLFYGNNKGLIQETIKNKFQQLAKDKIHKYEENEIIKNTETFIENICNKSFFENEKFIIIFRATDKLFKIIEEVIKKNIEGVTILLISEVLEKKSKLRSFFEKSKETICVPFYEDNERTLNLLATNFFKEKKIPLSQQNIKCGPVEKIIKGWGEMFALFREKKKAFSGLKNLSLPPFSSFRQEVAHLC